MGFERTKSALAGSRFADVRWVESTGSTNADVLAILTGSSATPAGGTAGSGAAGRIADVVLIADHQTAGRGRLGRTWEAPPGASLLMTVGFPADPVPERRPLALTALGVAAVDACSTVAGVSVGLKWPNDLVGIGVGSDGGDRKLAGILAEVHPIPGRGDAELIGIGVNCNWAGIPDELDGIATALNLLAGAEVDREDLAAAILRGFSDNLALLDTVDGRSTLLDRARERSATLGRRVRVELPRSELVGTARDLLSDGSLVVVDDAGTRHEVTVGDVVHLRPTD